MLARIAMGDDMKKAKARIQKHFGGLGFLVLVTGFDHQTLTIAIRPKAGYSWDDL